jgi:radical SAM protein with 4Fe4S-binding SPASM domain
VELTDRCNLACIHCYLAAGPKGSRILKTERVKAMLDDYFQMGCTSVAFSGGEPLLHPDWQNIVEYASNLGLRITVVTNGMALHQKNLDTLSAANATIALSVDGADEESHDAMRGSGSYNRIREALRLLASNEAQARTIICFTPTKLNSGEFSKLTGDVSTQGFINFYISFLETRGRANGSGTRLSMDVADQVALLKELVLLNGCNPEIQIETGHLRYMFYRLFYDWQPFGDPLETTLRVTPDGSVYLTAYVDNEQFCLGNLQRSSLYDCWNSSRTWWLIERAETRFLNLTKCRDCPYRIVCGCGSPARSFAVSGRFDEPDDWCDAKKQFLEEWFDVL